jgi:hypothetical protein
VVPCVKEDRTVQLTISSDEPLDHVLEVVSALYGVSLVKREKGKGAEGVALGLEEDGDQGITIIRH